MADVIQWLREQSDEIKQGVFDQLGEMLGAEKIESTPSDVSSLLSALGEEKTKEIVNKLFWKPDPARGYKNWFDRDQQVTIIAEGCKEGQSGILESVGAHRLVILDHVPPTKKKRKAKDAQEEKKLDQGSNQAPRSPS